MYFSLSTVAALVACTSAVVAAPAAVPTANGFPNPNATGLAAIQKQAQGTLPNGAPPANLSADGITNLQLIALNELFEVAYFTQLIQNITQNVTGYEISDYATRNYTLQALYAIRAQEELHALSANTALAHFNQTPISPCNYSFPVTTYQGAIALAATFTDVVLGTLQDVVQVFAEIGAGALSRQIASVIGQEGEQEGFFRLVGKKRPSALPFLTTSVRDFAFTAIQSFTVPGTCTNLSSINLKTFQPLNLLTNLTGPGNATLQFSFTNPTNSSLWSNGTTLYAVYINQQNMPIVQNTTMVSSSGNMTTLSAFFPYEQYEMNGLTIAALGTSAGPFMTANAVVNSTVFGPALIEIN